MWDGGLIAPGPVIRWPGSGGGGGGTRCGLPVGLDAPGSVFDLIGEYDQKVSIINHAI